MQSVDVEIFGKRYLLKSDEPEKIKKCSNFLDAHMTKVSEQLGLLDTNQVFLFSSLLLTEEYLDLKNEFESLKNKLNKLEKTLEKIL